MDKKWQIKWIEDLEQLKYELPEKHKNLYFYKSEIDFFSAIDALKNDLERLNHFNVICEIGKIISSFKDAHTTLMLPGKWFLPIEFYWFKEGIYIVGAEKKYKHLINKRVTHINDVEIEEIVHDLGEVISCENDQFLKSQLPKYLKVAEILYGLDIIDDMQEVEIRTENEWVVLESIECIKLDDGFDILDNFDSLRLPLYRKNKEKNFWWEYLNQERIIYINYNCCKDMEDQRVTDFDKVVRSFIDTNNIVKIVVDLRNNLGGDSTLLEPFIYWLRDLKEKGRKWQIFTIIGRDTFSSALLNAYFFKNDLGALILGEATGGKPNCYGEVRYFELNNTKMRIRYSTKYYKILEDDQQLSLYPDIAFEVSFKDYIEYKDPVLEYIINSGI